MPARKRKNSKRKDCKHQPVPKQRKTTTDKKTEENNQAEDINEHVHQVIYDGQEAFQVVRTQTKSKVAPSSLESVDNLPSLQKEFNVSKYIGKTIYYIDMGSSFIKACNCTVPKEGTDLLCRFLRFDGDKKDFLPSRSWIRVNQTGSPEVKTGSPEEVSTSPSSWEEIENIKKVFMVSELLEIEFKGGRRERVADLISLITTNIFKNLTTKKTRNKSYFHGVSALFFTCPTGTSDYVKLIYRNAILDAFTRLSSNTLNLNDVYITEESSCLQHFVHASLLVSNSGVMIADLGHLTLDVIMLEMKEKEPIVTFKNGNASGISLIHDVFTKHGIDPCEAMAELFDDPESEELPPHYQDLEDEIQQALEKITKPLAMMMFHNGVKLLYFCGAITKLVYFRKSLEKMVSVERLEQVKKELSPYLKDEYLNKNVESCEIIEESSGGSALLRGIESIITSSLKSRDDNNPSNASIPLILKEEPSVVGTNSTNETEDQFVPAMIQESEIEQDGKTSTIKELVLNGTLFDMYVKQDTELFLLRFSPLIDINKVKTITQENCERIGLLEFLRFTRLKIYFDRSIDPIKHCFYLRLQLEKDYLASHIYYKKKRNFFKVAVKIEHKMDEELGTGPRDEIEEYNDHDEEEEIECLNDEDLNSLKKHLSKCVNCGGATSLASKHNTSYTTIDDYNKYLGKDIGLGLICNSCYQKYYNKKRDKQSD
ncbi:predicted protein [Naegleria gruberi]|uniref:Predicted protein n=1 Tax=Naegleria gruberi TaxID=5762 RepID=D2V8J0_NAEGR|nr:uncharacterized protein NAEGRDRAFT_65173 [Naegleria gruberi]EFC46816.1 predicted protein [Naegleria gruberi]|eukprot:XP_002679560.1 predicted protein [Naegleria gruberi strain NEG-M]